MAKTYIAANLNEMAAPTIDVLVLSFWILAVVLQKSLENDHNN